MKEFNDTPLIIADQLTKREIAKLLKYYQDMFLNTTDYAQCNFPFAEQKPVAMQYGPPRKERGGKLRRW